MERVTPYGEMFVHDEVLAMIAGLAASDNEGVVGMASRRMTDGIAVMLHRDNLARGVKLQEIEDGYTVDLSLIVSYGVKIREVAKRVAIKVNEALYDAIGQYPARVTIHVEGVRRIKADPS